MCLLNSFRGHLGPYSLDAVKAHFAFVYSFPSVAREMGAEVREVDGGGVGWVGWGE